MSLARWSVVHRLGRKNKRLTAEKPYPKSLRFLGYFMPIWVLGGVGIGLMGERNGVGIRIKCDKGLVF